MCWLAVSVLFLDGRSIPGSHWAESCVSFLVANTCIDHKTHQPTTNTNPPQHTIYTPPQQPQCPPLSSAVLFSTSAAPLPRASARASSWQRSRRAWLLLTLRHTHRLKNKICFRDVYYQIKHWYEINPNCLDLHALLSLPALPDIPPSLHCVLPKFE